MHRTPPRKTTADATDHPERKVDDTTLLPNDGVTEEATQGQEVGSVVGELEEEASSDEDALAHVLEGRVQFKHLGNLIRVLILLHKKSEKSHGP